MVASKLHAADRRTDGYTDGRRNALTDGQSPLSCRYYMPDTVTGLESLDFASIFRGSSRLAGAPIEIVMFIIF